MKSASIIAAALVGVAALQASAQEPSPRTGVAWGASLTSSIDMSGHDMSTVGMDAYVGMRAPLIQILGLGAGINVPVSNSMHTMPFYIMARSNFRHKPSLCFMEAKAGVSVNDIAENKKQTGAYASVGLGINLASSAKFSSHLTLAYSYFGRKDYADAAAIVKVPSLHMATLRLGLTF